MDLNVIKFLLSHLRVNKLGKIIFEDEWISFTKVRDESVWPPYTLGLQFKILWISSKTQGFDPWGWEKLFHVYIFHLFTHFRGWMLLYWLETLVYSDFGRNILDELQLFFWDSCGTILWHSFFFCCICVNVFYYSCSFQLYDILISQVW